MRDTPAPLRALVLDFDGTIVESNDIKTEAFAALFARFPEHAGAMLDYHHAHVSESRYVKFEHLVYQRLGRKGDRALVDQLAGEFSSLLRERMLICPMVAGAPEFLEEFSAKVPLYISSVTPEPELVRLLEARKLAGFFRRVFGCPPWSKKEAIAAVLQNCGGSEGVALIGDSTGDEHAASACGIEFIARDSGLPLASQVTAFPDLHAIAGALRSRLPA